MTDRHRDPRPARDRHDPDPLDRRRPAGELRPSRARRWARRRWPTRSGRASSATPRPTPTGRTATASSCRAGHASMLLYSLLHLTGYDVSLDDLKSFRQWGSQHAGPPRVRPDAGRRGDDRAARPGLRERGRAWRSPSAASRPSSTATATTIVDHRTYVHLLRRRPPGGHRVGGGVARRPPRAWASSSPSTTTTASSSTARPRWPGREDVLARFEAYGWHAQRVEDGNDVEAIAAAIEAARADDRPSLIAVRTHIGYGSPNKQDTAEGARRAARPGRGPPDQGGLRLGSRTRRSTSRTRRGELFRARGPGGRGARRRLGGARSTAYARRVSRPRPPSSGAAIAGAPAPTAGTRA